MVAQDRALLFVAFGMPGAVAHATVVMSDTVALTFVLLWVPVPSSKASAAELITGQTRSIQRAYVRLGLAEPLKCRSVAVARR